MSPLLQQDRQQSQQDDGLDGFRGIFHGTWMGLLMWAVIIGAVLLMTGCTAHSSLPYSTPGDRLATDYVLGRGPSEIPDLRRLIEGPRHMSLVDQLVSQGLSRTDADDLIRQYGEAAIGQVWQETVPPNGGTR